MLNKILLDQYLNNKHIEFPDEYSTEIEANANDLLTRVNALLQFLDLRYTVHCASGFRPISYNLKLKERYRRQKRNVKVALNSNHTKGLAIDLSDQNKNLSVIITGKDYTDETLLKQFDLYMEHPSATPSWVHLQSVPPRSGKRIFYP